MSSEDEVKYKHVTYGVPVTVSGVEPEDRAEDVLYAAITGCYKGGRSLAGVKYKVTFGKLGVIP